MLMETANHAQLLIAKNVAQHLVSIVDGDIIRRQLVELVNLQQDLL